MASVYPKSFMVTSFELQPDGRYMASIPAATHGLGTNCHVTKMIRRDSDNNWQNMLAVYRILSKNGKTPSVVMRKNGSNYGVALVDVQTVGTNVVITSDEAFESYIILV